MSTLPAFDRPINGTPVNRLAKPASRRAASAKPEARQVARQSAKALAGHQAARWATGYVVLSVSASCGLNAYANTQHAPSEPVALVLAGALGVLVPVLVLVLGKVASLAWKAGRQRLAGVLGAIGCAVLGLSVVHCTEAIALLTGSSHVLALLLAIGIDCGLVGCEVTATVSE